METTSAIAYNDFKAQGKKDIHHNLILKSLNGNILTAYGISTKTGISRVAVSRRTSELERLNKIEKVCKLRDRDGAMRMSYKLKENTLTN